MSTETDQTPALCGTCKKLLCVPGLPGCARCIATELESLRAERDELKALTDAQATAAREAAEDHRGVVADWERRAASLTGQRDELRRVASSLRASHNEVREKFRRAVAEHAGALDRIARVHAVLAGATWRYAMVRAADVRAALTGADEGLPLVDVIAAAIVMHRYPPDEWPDGPPGEDKHEQAREEAAVIVRAITGAPEPASEAAS